MSQANNDCTIPSAEIVCLADWREGHQTKQPQAAEPWFISTLWPGNDYNHIGHVLTAAATALRKGAIDRERIADLLDGLSANAHLSCKTVREIEFRMIRAEKKLRPKDAPKIPLGRERVEAIRYSWPKKRKAKRR